jgi:DNA-binding MarR family transcriptional regulator
MITMAPASSNLLRQSAGPALAPKGCTNMLLRQLTRRVQPVYDAHLAELGIKVTQYTLLAHLSALQPVAPGALAQALGMTASTLTRNLKPLLAAGWVAMGDGPDGRTRHVWLTDTGTALRTQARVRWKRAQTEVNTTLGAERVVALHTLVQDCLALLQPEPEENVDEG